MASLPANDATVVFCASKTEELMTWLPADDAREAYIFFASSGRLGAGSHLRNSLGRKPSRFVSSLECFPWSSQKSQRGPGHNMLPSRRANRLREAWGGTIYFWARSAGHFINLSLCLYLDKESLTKHFSSRQFYVITPLQNTTRIRRVQSVLRT